MSFTKILPDEIRDNVFRLIGDDWALITAGDQSALNTMTASWGSMGVLWNKPVVHCFIRPQRHTYSFVERHDTFTLSFFDEAYRQALKLCGTKSGRDTDKVALCGFTPAFAESGAPYFEEARLVLVCKKLYSHDIQPARFVDRDVNAHYPQNDYHREYVAEIVEVLMKTEE